MRVLDVGPWIVYPPAHGQAARAFTLLSHLSARHDVRHFGRGEPDLRRPRNLLEEVPVTPMFRVYRYRPPLSDIAAEWLLAHEGPAGLRTSVARRVVCPPRLRELLDWANVIVAEDALELALCRREHPAGRYVFVAHGVGLPSSVSPTGHDRVADAVAAAELTITTSEADRVELLARYGLDPSRALAVPTPVDTELLAPTDADARRALRAELGLPDRPTAVFVGAATPANRLGLSWIRRLAEHDDRFTFVVAGSVGVPERRRNLVVTGPVHSVVPYLRAADAAVCPIEQAVGTRVKLLESLAAGLPSVVFAEALHGTELEDGVHVAVAEKSEEALLSALTRVTGEGGDGARLGEAGRAFVAERHDVRRSAGLLEEALLGLLDARPQAGPPPGGAVGHV